MRRSAFSIFFAMVVFQLFGQNPQVSTGTLKRLEAFPSKYVPARNVDVWLPNGYSAKKKYAVLYMHDGQMLFDSTNTWNKQEWRVDETVGKLIADGRIKECIVVASWSGKNRHGEYFPQKAMFNIPNDSNKVKLMQKLPMGAYADNYLKFLVFELKPYVDSAYSTRKEPKNTFVAGSSMGGLISMYAMCEYPNVFGGAACLSTHWIGIYSYVNNPIPGAILTYMDATLPSPKNHRVYFDYGTKTLDSLYKPAQLKVDSLMIAKGYTSKSWETLEFVGADHSERSWSSRLGIPIEFLLKK